MAARPSTPPPDLAAARAAATQALDRLNDPSVLDSPGTSLARGVKSLYELLLGPVNPTPADTASQGLAALFPGAVGVSTFARRGVVGAAEKAAREAASSRAIQGFLQLFRDEGLSEDAIRHLMGRIAKSRRVVSHIDEVVPVDQAATRAKVNLRRTPAQQAGPEAQFGGYSERTAPGRSRVALAVRGRSLPEIEGTLVEELGHTAQRIGGKDTADLLHAAASQAGTPYLDLPQEIAQTAARNRRGVPRPSIGAQPIRPATPLPQLNDYLFGRGTWDATRQMLARGADPNALRGGLAELARGRQGPQLPADVVEAAFRDRRLGGRTSPPPRYVDADTLRAPKD